MQKVFITGGAGFIGRWIVQRCVKAGRDVTVYDNLSAGSLDHVLPFMDDITMHEADIMDAEALEAALAEAQPDVVFHMAALHFIPYCNEHPAETIRVNVEGTERVLRTAAAQGATRAVVASSGAFYPSIDEVLTEDIEPAPVDIYGLSKQLTEEVAAYTARATDMTCVAARLFNTYGPYETNPHLIPHIMDSLHSGPSIELGNIYSKRDYIYVEDVAELLISCAEAEVKEFERVNVGTGHEYSAEEIVEGIAELMGTEIAIDVDESRLRAVDKMHQRASTEHLRKVAGRGASIDLRTGLQRLLQEEALLSAK